MRLLIELTYGCCGCRSCRIDRLEWRWVMTQALPGSFGIRFAPMPPICRHPDPVQACRESAARPRPTALENLRMQFLDSYRARQTVLAQRGGWVKTTLAISAAAAAEAAGVLASTEGCESRLTYIGANTSKSSNSTFVTHLLPSIVDVVRYRERAMLSNSMTTTAGSGSELREMPEAKLSAGPISGS